MQTSSSVRKTMFTSGWKCGLCALAVLPALSGCSRPAPAALTVCDVTKMAYQSPQFIDRYFAYRQHADFSGVFDPTKRVTRNFEYGTREDSPGILVIFYRNQVTELTVFFPHQQTPEESARRIGLNLSDFRPVSRTSWLLALKGTSKGVPFKSLQFTNMVNQQPGTWNVIAKFSDSSSQFVPFKKSKI